MITSVTIEIWHSPTEKQRVAIAVETFEDISEDFETRTDFLQAVENAILEAIDKYEEVYKNAD